MSAYTDSKHGKSKTFKEIHDRVLKYKIKNKQMEITAEDSIPLIVFFAQENSEYKNHSIVFEDLSNYFCLFEDALECNTDGLFSNTFGTTKEKEQLEQIYLFLRNINMYEQLKQNQELNPISMIMDNQPHDLAGPGNKQLQEIIESQIFP